MAEGRELKVNTNELKNLLNEQDRDFILRFFNMTSDFENYEDEFDIDVDLENNFELFFTLCDFMYENTKQYYELRCKFKEILSAQTA